MNRIATCDMIHKPSFGEVILRAIPDQFAVGKITDEWMKQTRPPPSSKNDDLIVFTRREDRPNERMPRRVPKSHASADREYVLPIRQRFKRDGHWLAASLVTARRPATWHEKRARFAPA